MQKSEEKWKRMVRNAQMGLWVALILVQMAVVNRLEVRAETGAVMAEAEEAGGGDQEADGGGTGEEADGGTKEAVAEYRAVQRDVVYERVEGGAVLPGTVELQVREAGKTMTAVCSMQEKTLLREQWEDGFSFPITFHTYDADYYELGDQKIPYNEERPELDGCEEQLLELIGMPPEEYQITALQWAGEPYLGEDGEVCRDAMGSGRKLVRDYRVRYAGTVRIPARPEAEPETGQEETAQEATEQTVREPEPADTGKVQVSIEESDAESRQEGEPLTFWQKITRTMFLIVGIGALLFFGGLLILAFLRVVKKLQKWYTEQKYERSNKRRGKEDI